MELFVLNQISGAPEPSVNGPHGLELAAGQLSWRKSSRCGTHGSCVEVAALDNGAFAVRDGKAPLTSPVLVFSDAEWRSFVDAVKAGEFEAAAR